MPSPLQLQILEESLLGESEIFILVCVCVCVCMCVCVCVCVLRGLGYIVEGHIILK